MKDAVILIPSYEPDDLLVDVVMKLKENGFPVLLVNDGSGPEFDHVFNQVMDEVKYLAFPKNKGKGAAMKYGYKHLLEFYPDAKYVITADGDGQHAIKDIVRVYDLLLEHNKIVFGVRDFGKDVPFRSKFGNEFSKTTRTLCTKQYIPDDQCGLRGFPVRYIPELIKIKGNRYEYEMNQIVEFQMMQTPFYTLPIETIYLDGNSRSHFSPFKDTFRIQTIIFTHSITALLCNLALVFLMILGFKHEVFSLTGVVIVSYSLAFLIYFLIINILYPTRSFFRRLFKELLFTAIKMGSCHILLLLTVFVLNWPYAVMTPIGVFLCVFLNIPFAWLLRKMFPTF